MISPGFPDPGIAGRVGTLDPVLDQRDDAEFPYDAKRVALELLSTLMISRFADG
jgi:hypothetical protein